MMIEETLRNIGLTNYEAKIYLALLDLGKATSGEILRKSKLNTGRLYDILSSLNDKGFISELIEEGVKKFYPADPKQIFEYLEKKKEILIKQEIDLEKSLPELIKKINLNKESDRVEVFFGIKGLKTAHKKEIDNYQSKETLRIIGIMGREKYPKDLYDYYINNLYSKRIASKVKVMKILDTAAKKFRRDHEKNANIKYLPYVSPVAIVTIGNLTIIDIVTENPIVITIESKEVANSFVQQFNFLWEIAKI